MSKLRVFPRQINVNTSTEILDNNELFINSENQNIYLYSSEYGYKLLSETLSVRNAKISYELEKQKILDIRAILLNHEYFYNGEIYKLDRKFDIVKYYNESFKNQENSIKSDWYMCPESFIMDIVPSSNIDNISTPSLYKYYFSDITPNAYTHIVFKIKYPVSSNIDKDEGLSWQVDNIDLKASHILRSVTYPMHIIKESWYIENDIMNIIFKAAIDRNSITSENDFISCDGIKLEYTDSSEYSSLKNNVTVSNMNNIEIEYYGVNKYSEYSVSQNTNAQYDNVIE
jgi:hypothetical protein